MPFWFPMIALPAIIDSVVVLYVALRIVPQKIAKSTADVQRTIEASATEFVTALMGANTVEDIVAPEASEPEGE